MAELEIKRSTTVYVLTLTDEEAADLMVDINTAKHYTGVNAATQNIYDLLAQRNM